MTHWFYAIDRQQYGPVDHETLLDLISTGRVRREDLVWRDGYSDWAIAESVDGLFAPRPEPVDDAVEHPHAAQTFDPPGALEAADRLRTPLLVSAIANVVIATVWGATFVCLPLSVPIVVLCVFEFMLYNRSDRMPLSHFAHEVRALSIFQMIVGVLNPIALVCGILLYIESGNRLGR